MSRNEPMGIVGRTRKNLVFMRNARKAGADIHEVTHLLNSLLGLIVIPWERLERNIFVENIEKLEQEGWPRVQELENTYPGETGCLEFLVNRLRNAIAHGCFRFEGAASSFSPDSREPSEVKVIMADRRKDRRNKKTYKWQAEINGEDLYRFCDKFIQHIEKRIGEERVG